MARGIKIAAFLAVLASLSGCATVPVGTEGIEAAYCQAAKPISWSQTDSDQTIREVKSHNAVYKKLCG